MSDTFTTMSETRKQVQIGDRAWEIQGDEQDHYFRRAQDHAHHLANGLLRAAAGRVRPDSTILDIGANIGLSTLGLSALVPEGRVIAFEPSPRTARHLEANVIGNGARNVTVVAAAVGSEAGTVRFATPPGSSSGAFVVREGNTNRPAETVDVPVIALDEWLEEHGVSRADFVKLDIEGYEPWALHGARRWLSRERPPIFMEFNSWTLLAFADVNPVTFAKRLWQSYRVLAPGQDGEPELANPIAFAHDNLVKHGCVEDIVMELRVPEAPRLEEMIAGN